MLVATPGQTTSYSTLHTNNSNGGGSNSTAAGTIATKNSSTLKTINATASGAAKCLNNNNKHTTSIGTSRTSLNSNTHTTAHNCHQNSKNENKINNQNKAAATSSREFMSPNITAATTHSLKHELSTNTTNTTTTKQQSFIQTLKDSVQKALIGSSSNNSIANKYSTDHKLQNNSNKSTTSAHNISSSSSTSHNANKVSTTTSSNALSNSTIATQSSSSASAARSKYFSCSLSKLHTVAPTVIHRYPEERQKASSTDSLQKEMCHFKPIRIVPKTPWKSGSKSRGNSLRFPKAKLATKKTEFVLKSNCDVNNSKRKQQQNRAQTDQINMNEGDDDDNEQENKEFYAIYKPKPSLTCLSTSINTPNHQSAFVCMIAQMKNLVNLQSKRQIRTAKSAGAISTVASNEPLKELLDRRRPAKRQQKEVVELPKIRSARLVSIAVKNKSVPNKTNSQTVRKKRVKQTNTKLNISKMSTVSLSKAKSRSKSGSVKSKTIDFVELAATKAREKLQNSVSMPAVSNKKSKTTATGNTSGRKRKSTQEDANDLQYQELSLSPPSTTKTVSMKSSSLGSRKSSRLSTKNSLFKYSINISSQQSLNKSPRKARRNLTSVLCFSPPLTRSRHRHLAELEDL